MSYSADPFWIEIEEAFKTVSTYPHLEVTVERGDKSALVRNIPDKEAVYIKITEVPLEVVSVELNPLAKEKD